jgi:hypothetical protein
VFLKKFQIGEVGGLGLGNHPKEGLTIQPTITLSPHSLEKSPGMGNLGKRLNQLGVEL